MTHRAKCCVCPWQTKARFRSVVMIHAQTHQLRTGHTRIKLKEKA